jgi:ABC-type branched-subunit amino acid transport system ATPase component
MIEPMLKVDVISVHYGRLAAVRGVSLSVGRGEIVCLVGPRPSPASAFRWCRRAGAFFHR